MFSEKEQEERLNAVMARREQRKAATGAPATAVPPGCRTTIVQNTMY